MKAADNVYIELQKHLDKQAVGFPATKSGVEIRILKELFTPEQAGLALHISYQPQSALDIHNQVKDAGISLEKIRSLLKEMERNGAICSTLKNARSMRPGLMIGMDIQQSAWSAASGAATA